MTNSALRLRLIELLQKSRQALRLYTTLGRGPHDKNGEFAEAQASEWSATNAQLLKDLTPLVDANLGKSLVQSVFTLRDRLGNEFRASETEMRQKQRELITASENGDFVKGAILSRQLVTLKARCEATQAAHHELSEVVDKSRVVPPTIELTSDKIVRERVRLMPAQVIPLRRTK